MAGAVRVDLASEAIRRGRALVDLMPDEPETPALLALMLLNDSRCAARFRNGELVLLDDQDRSLWDQMQIEEIATPYGVLASGATPRRDSPTGARSR